MQSEHHLINTEHVGWIVVYDLKSEQFKFLYEENDKIQPAEKAIKKMLISKISTCRMNSTVMLHKLGLPSSNSVLLIPQSTTESIIDSTINSVEEKYKQVNLLLRESNMPEIGQPYIRKVEIVKFQFSSFREMAEYKLKEKLDEQISYLSKKIGELVNIDVNKRRSAASRYKNEVKDMDSIMDLAKNLDINVDDEIGMLTALLRKAISVVE